MADSRSLWDCRGAHTLQPGGSKLQPLSVLFARTGMSSRFVSADAISIGRRGKLRFQNAPFDREDDRESTRVFYPRGGMDMLN